MSLVEELAAHIRGASEELPLPAVVAAAGRLRIASDLLMWVRQASARTLGVPELSAATERLEGAAAALLVAQDELAAYLTAIGMAHQGAPFADDGWRAAMRPSLVRPAVAEQDEPVAPLARWWQERVDALTGTGGGYDAKGAARTSQELLKRLAERGDRAALRRELVRVDAPVGLGLAALTPPVLHRLTGRLLGHQPRGEDLPRLFGTVRSRLRELLPTVDDRLTGTLLARACRVPAKEAEERLGPDRYGHSGQPHHPADSAIAGAALVAVLLKATGQDARAVDPEHPEALVPAHA